MLTLCIRTDKTEAELYLYDDDIDIGELRWQAHRQLAETIHQKIEELITNCSPPQGGSLQDIEKVFVYQGPGSFTGLRIGLSVANTVAYSLNIPIVGAEGENWIEECLAESEIDSNPVPPVYGSEPNITKQKK